ncbi:hypothetical protein PFISCL1PPCAC_7116, partial [Pristionchus fissidentatus]
RIQRSYYDTSLADRSYYNDYSEMISESEDRMDQTVSSGGDASEDLAKYLDELVKDMRELNALPGAFPHGLRLLNEEIDRVWCVLYPGGMAGRGRDTTTSTVSPTVSPMPSPSTPVFNNLSGLGDTFTPSTPRSDRHHDNILAIQRAYAALVCAQFDPYEGGVTVQEKIPIPYSPRCNFIGRILGPRGISVKQIEGETGCTILIRGRGSVKDPVREARLLNQAGYEHLTEPLHVLIKATDISQVSAESKLRRGVSAISKLLIPMNDEHKRRQLVQLAIINGTYRCDDDS